MASGAEIEWEVERILDHCNRGVSSRHSNSPRFLHTFVVPVGSNEVSHQMERILTRIQQLGAFKAFKKL